MLFVFIMRHGIQWSFAHDQYALPQVCFTQSTLKGGGVKWTEGKIDCLPPIKFGQGKWGWGVAAPRQPPPVLGRHP